MEILAQRTSFLDATHKGMVLEVPLHQVILHVYTWSFNCRVLPQEMTIIAFNQCIKLFEPFNSDSKISFQSSCRAQCSSEDTSAKHSI